MSSSVSPFFKRSFRTCVWLCSSLSVIALYLGSRRSTSFAILSSFFRLLRLSPFFIKLSNPISDTPHRPERGIKSPDYFTIFSQKRKAILHGLRIFARPCRVKNVSQRIFPAKPPFFGAFCKNPQPPCGRELPFSGAAVFALGREAPRAARRRRGAPEIQLSMTFSLPVG